MLKLHDFEQFANFYLTCSNTVSLVLVIYAKFSRLEGKLVEFTEVILTLVITIVNMPYVVYIYSITVSKNKKKIDWNANVS